MIPKGTNIHRPTMVVSAFMHCSIPSTKMVLTYGDTQCLNVSIGLHAGLGMIALRKY